MVWNFTRGLSSVVLGVATVSYTVAILAQCLASVAKSPTPPQSPLKEIVLKFPVKAIGGLYICPRNSEESDTNPFNAARREAAAAGTVKLKLYSNECVLLELNPETLQHPERLKEVDPRHIERLKASYLNMDDTPRFSVMDRVMKFVPCLKELYSVDLSGSDLTDVGFKELRLLPKLKSINCTNTALEGTTFGALAPLSFFQILNLTNVVCKPHSLEALASCKTLVSLHLRGCNLTNNDLIFLPALQKLLSLDIGKNPKINDSVLPVVCKLQNLRFLFVNGTKISTTGLINANLEQHVRWLELASPANRSQMQALKSKLPESRIWYPKETLTEENLKLFAPPK